MKRFYRDVRVERTDLGWHVALDGRPIRTQGGAPQLAPTEALAKLLADEWERQGDTLDPGLFHHRDTIDYAIDVVANDREPVIDKLLDYAGTDTLCYRAHPDEPLFSRQDSVWEPLLQAIEAREGLRLHRVSGVIPRDQPLAALKALRRRLDKLDPYALAALEQLTSLSASLCIGLAALEPDADGRILWDAANLEEDWQAELWGEDAEAAARRARRERDFMAAIDFARAARA